MVDHWIVQKRFCKYAFEGDVPQMEQMLREGISIDMEGLSFNPGEAAIHGKQWSSWRFLVEHGLDPSDSLRWTQHAISYQWMSFLEHLKSTGVDLGPHFFLESAIMTGNPEIVDFLIRSGSKIHETNHAGDTALHLAAENGLPDIVRLLLAADVKVDSLSKSRKTPLMCACMQLWSRISRTDVEVNYESVVEQLLDSNADPNFQESDSLFTPLHFVCSSDGQTESSARIVGLLLTHDADPNIQDTDGCTPLHQASIQGQVECARILIERAGAQVSQADSVGNTPLLVAGRFGHLELVRLFLNEGARIDDETSFGENVLHRSIDYPEIVREVLSLGANPSKQSHDGKSPLHLACIVGNIASVKLLLRAKADTQLHDLQGRSALAYAKENAHDEIVEILSFHSD